MKQDYKRAIATVNNHTKVCNVLSSKKNSLMFIKFVWSSVIAKEVQLDNFKITVSIQKKKETNNLKYYYHC